VLHGPRGYPCGLRTPGLRVRQPLPAPGPPSFPNSTAELSDVDQTALLWSSGHPEFGGRRARECGGGNFALGYHGRLGVQRADGRSTGTRCRPGRRRCADDVDVPAAATHVTAATAANTAYPAHPDDVQRFCRYLTEVCDGTTSAEVVEPTSKGWSSCRGG
ncbi:MAG: hypothetical protein ACRDRD_13185, partial [Pseudonocardiaceae bacterium]